MTIQAIRAVSERPRTKTVLPTSSHHPDIVLTRWLRAEGLDDAAVRAATAHLHRLRRGAYARTAPKDELQRHRLQALAVVLRWTGDFVASHVSAAVLHGLATPDVDLTTVHMTYARNCLRRGGRHGVRSHDGPALDGEVVEVDGIPLTGVARTVVDCARILPLEQAVVMADDALHRGLVTSEELHARATRWKGVQGIAGARQMIRFMDGRAESPGETRTRLTLTGCGIRVQPQVAIRDHDGLVVARADLKVEDAPVLVEFDGRAKYSATEEVEQAHWNEKLRHDALRNLGYEIVRVTWRDLSDAPRIERWVNAAVARTRTSQDGSGSRSASPGRL